MSVPLIFFHSGFDPYLAFTLWQARRANPGSSVWLIGDDSNDLSSLGVRHFRFADLAPRREEFVGIYRHFSGHQLENERLCFERWFYLDILLEKQGIEQFCFLDSDYFLLTDVGEMVPAWNGLDVAGAPVWAFAWFARRALIREFCDYTLERFRNTDQLESWERRFKAGEDFWPPDGIFNVCDMTLWRMFIRERSLRHLDLSVPKDGVVFDSGLSYPAGFRMRGEYKALTRRTGNYFGLHEVSGETVRFAALHLNGKYAKRLQPPFTGWPWPVLRACWRPNHRRNLRKLFQIAAHSWHPSNRPFSAAAIA